MSELLLQQVLSSVPATQCVTLHDMAFAATPVIQSGMHFELEVSVSEIAFFEYQVRYDKGGGWSQNGGVPNNW